MKVAGSNLTYTPDPNGASPLCRYEASQGAYLALSPNANNRYDEIDWVTLWCWGAKIEGSITVTDEDANQYPHLNGPAKNYWVGLIQIIKEQPVMINVYENRQGEWFTQNTVPVYDANTPFFAPWYNPGTRETLKPGNNAQTIKLEDRPTQPAQMRLGGLAGGSRLHRTRKELRFGVYLAVAPKRIGDQFDRGEYRILRHLEWTTKTWLTINWAADGSFTWMKHNFGCSTVAQAAVNIVTTQVQSDAVITSDFPAKKGSANKEITKRTHTWP